jgi:hypothetical protein
MSTQFTSPEIHDAMRTAGRAAFRLEDEYHSFDWDERLELARDIRSAVEEATDDPRMRNVATQIAHRLESEAFDLDSWEERLSTANLARSISRGLTTQEGAAR